MLLAALLFVETTTLYAAIIDPHAYTKRDRDNIVSQASRMSLDTGAEDLTSNWSSSNPYSFITKEMWVIFSTDTSGQPNQWIEIGQVKGGVNKNYWNGHYEAIKRYQNGSLIYTETPLSYSGDTGPASYEISYGGKSSLGYDFWNVYINGINYDYWTIPFISSIAQHVGIESNDSLNTFKTGTKITNIGYTKDGTSYWWTSSMNGDSNYLNWSSTFQYDSTSNTNSAVFTGSGGV
jgi:hypothetical protein